MGRFEWFAPTNPKARAQWRGVLPVGVLWGCAGLRPVKSWDEFVELGGHSDAIRVVLDDVFEALQDERHAERIIRQLEADIFCFVRVKEEKAIYSVQGGKLLPVESWDEFGKLGGRADLVREISVEQYYEIERTGAQSLLDAR